MASLVLKCLHYLGTVRAPTLGTRRDRPSSRGSNQLTPLARPAAQLQTPVRRIFFGVKTIAENRQRWITNVLVRYPIGHHGRSNPAFG